MCTNDYLGKLSYLDDIWLIDTCSILEVSCLCNLLRNKDEFVFEGAKLLIIKSVYEELNKALYSYDESKSRNAQRALNIIKSNTDLFIIEGLNERLNIDEAFADPEIISFVTKKCIKKPQLVITQDRKLATDLLNINKYNSVNTKKVFVCFLGDDGELYMNKGIEIKDNKPKETRIIEVISNEEKELSLLDDFAKPLMLAAGGFALGSFVNEYKREIARYINGLSRRIVKCIQY